MAKMPVDVSVRKFDPSMVTLHVQVHVTRELRIRKWIAVRLIKVAAWILGMGTDISIENREE